MKLTPNEKETCYKKALTQYVIDGHVTWKEAYIYSYLRSFSFFSKTKNKRNLCRISAPHFQTEYGMNKNKVSNLLKKLERAKLVQPYYYIKSGDELIERTDMDGIYAIHIHHMKYRIKNVPGESDKKKELLKKKRTKPKK